MSSISSGVSDGGETASDISRGASADSRAGVERHGDFSDVSNSSDEISSEDSFLASLGNGKRRRSSGREDGGSHRKKRREGQGEDVSFHYVRDSTDRSKYYFMPGPRHNESDPNGRNQPYSPYVSRQCAKRSIVKGFSDSNGPRVTVRTSPECHLCQTPCF